MLNKKQGNQDNTKVTFYDKISRVRPRFFDQVGHETRCILKNEFCNQNFEMFKEVVHNFGKPDEVTI